MKKIYTLSVATIIFLSLFQIKSFSQTSVTSTTGYSVNLNVYPVSIVPASNNCTWGYNYTVKMSYNISITGPNAPASLYTLQGTIGCGSTSSFFDLPNNGGSGSVNSANAWNSSSDCNTATVASKNCNTVNIQIQGPGISNQTVSYSTIGVALGIKLLSFSADLDKNKVKINWATASETDNDYFSIERSTDGTQWKEIKRVKGAGTSSSVLTYETFDESPVAGTSYYRLKQTDFDGKMSYSNTQPIRYNPANKGISLYPVPNAGNTVNINGISNYSDHDFTVLNANGRVLFTTTLNKPSVDLPELQSGVYVIRLKDKSTGETENLRYVKI